MSLKDLVNQKHLNNSPKDLNILVKECSVYGMDGCKEAMKYNDELFREQEKNQWY